MQSVHSSSNILKFWFEDTKPNFWFKKSQLFDDSVRNHFEPTVEAALNGQLHAWSNDVDGCLALILVLDQFTRNIYRGVPAAFSGDSQALSLSLQCVTRRFVEHSNSNYRHFMLMPMMHSEDIATQDQSLPLFKQHTDERTHRVAIKHRNIIAQFGRFPHRNIILGRNSTEEEIEFLKEPGSSF